jgi:hypothetical protein
MKTPLHAQHKNESNRQTGQFASGSSLVADSYLEVFNKPIAMQFKAKMAMMEGSAHARQLKTLAACMASGHQTGRQNISSNDGTGKGVVQRNIDSTTFERSDAEAPSYVINQAARHLLYSDTHAAPPEPTELYTQSAEHDDAGQGRDVHAWQPNVAFFSNQQKQTFLGLGETGKSQAVALFKAQIETRHDDNAIENPRIGIMGKNDCGAFATALYNLIARKKARLNGGVGELTEQISQHVDNYPEMEVGDMMRHIFDPQEGVQGGCGWHAATVVAQQGGAAVTLEANVGKDLTRPEFFIRNGSAGFVQANHDDNEVGDRLEVTKYASGPAPTDDTSRYGTFDRVPALTAGNVATGETFKVYHDAIRRDITSLLTRQNCLAFWRRQTLLEESMPDGIIEMRAAIGNVLAAVGIGATRGAGGKPFSRSEDTHYFYQLMHRYQSFCDAPTTTAELKLIAAAIRRFPMR